MGQRLIISESERNQIAKMHRLINESIVGKGLQVFEFGNTRPGQTEPKYRVMITGPAKWVSNHLISIPVKTSDKRIEGEIVTKCTENYGFYFYYVIGSNYDYDNHEGNIVSEKVFFTREGENILKPEIKRLCAQFVSNDNGEDMSTMAEGLVSEQPNSFMDTDHEIKTAVLKCAMQFFDKDDLTRIPNCLAAAMTFMSQNRIPDPFDPKDWSIMQKCASEIFALDKDYDDYLEFFNCIASKIKGTPISMN